MDIQKIELFEDENDKGSFPWFRVLSSEECNRIQERVARALRLDSHADADAVLSRIRELKPERELAVDSDFDLARELSISDVDISGNILINWYKFDRTDEMNLLDFSQNFEGIWYARADDIEIFDETFSWIGSIFYFSIFSFYRL